MSKQFVTLDNKNLELKKKVKNEMRQYLKNGKPMVLMEETHQHARELWQVPFCVYFSFLLLLIFVKWTRRRKGFWRFFSACNLADECWWLCKRLKYFLLLGFPQSSAATVFPGDHKEPARPLPLIFFSRILLFSVCLSLSDKTRQGEANRSKVITS